MRQLNPVPASTASAIPPPQVQVLDGTILVDRLVTADRVAVDFYRALEPDRRGPTALDALNLGTRAFWSATNSATMASFNDHLDTALRAASNNLASLPITVNDRIAALCEKYFGDKGVFASELGKDLRCVQDALSTNGPLAAEFREAVAAEARRQVTAALEPLCKALNVNDPSGPLGLINLNLQALLTANAELREHVAGAINAHSQRAISVHKGYDLEGWVHSVLGPVAANLGDCFGDTSHTAGLIPACKDGDFTSVLDPGVTRHCDLRISVEAKHRKSETIASLCDVLDSANENRGSAVAIGVVTNPALRTRPIGLYGRDKIIVHVPDFGQPGASLEHEKTLLEMAYYIARTQAISLQKSAQGEIIDLSLLEQHLERVDAVVLDFRKLGRNLTAIETAVAKTRETSDEMREQLRSVASELKSLLAETAQKQAALDA